MTTVVIGSGPAGAAAAQGLCDRGVDVTVLDAGDTIEAGRMELFDDLARSDPERWPQGLARRARGVFPADIANVPRKPAYGSLFPYVLDDPDLPIARVHAATLSSLAYGGLSNAWGAALLPYRRRDIADWPISLEELGPHYEAVLRFVPIAAERDELAEVLPLYTDTPATLRRGRQTQALLAHLRRHARALERAGFTFGASRLAVVAAQEHPGHCRHCGLCLYGCPYRSIYNSARTVEALARDGRVDYRGGVYVDRLSESGDSVVIDFHERRRPRETGRLIASRVFVACGSISSTRLMFESIGYTRRAHRLKDSQYFAIPMLTRRAVPVSVATQGNTLAQVFVELEDARISAHAIHLQVYGYNDIMLSALARRLPVGEGALERFMQPLLGRMVVIQGFMHSADSPGLELVCDAGGLRVKGDDERAGVARVRRVARSLAAHGRLLGMAPVPGTAHVGAPGKSNHLGGSLPMRRQPGPLETDTLGRVPGWDRVHVVDASVFPSIPATTVTLSVMANAHRIAVAAAKIEAQCPGS
jgi:choline dehydrogenase-like flavoprotein